jgi:hypothetical protein
MLDVRRWTFAVRAAKQTEGFQRTGKRGGGCGGMGDGFVPGHFVEMQGPRDQRPGVRGILRNQNSQNRGDALA